MLKLSKLAQSTIPSRMLFPTITPLRSFSYQKFTPRHSFKHQTFSQNNFFSKQQKRTRTSWEKNWEQAVTGKNFWLILGGLIVCVITTKRTFKIVPAGHVGVVDFMGNVSKNTLKPGFHLINPLSHVSWHRS